MANAEGGVKATALLPKQWHSYWGVKVGQSATHSEKIAKNREKIRKEGEIGERWKNWGEKAKIRKDLLLCPS